jgi:hypothetical protein
VFIIYLQRIFEKKIETDAGQQTPPNY